MRIDASPTWHPIERITAVVRLRWAFSFVHATRWGTTGSADATIVAMSPITPQPAGTPVTVVSSPALQRAAGLAPERCVLDPQLGWFHRDEVCELSGPVLGVHLTANGGTRLLPAVGDRGGVIVTTVLIEPSSGDIGAFGGEVANGWQHLLGRHLAFITKWPLIAETDASRLPIPGGHQQLATQPSSYCREGIEEAPRR